MPQPEPIGVMRLPYSLLLQSVCGVFVNDAPEQASVDECIQPMLCPTSWTSTVQPAEISLRADAAPRAVGHLRSEVPHVVLVRARHHRLHSLLQAAVIARGH